MATEITPITKLAFLKKDYELLERLKIHEIDTTGLARYLWKRIKHFPLYALSRDQISSSTSFTPKYNSLQEVMEELPSA